MIYYYVTYTNTVYGNKGAAAFRSFDSAYSFKLEKERDPIMSVELFEVDTENCIKTKIE